MAEIRCYFMSSLSLSCDVTNNSDDTSTSNEDDDHVRSDSRDDGGMMPFSVF